MEQGSHLSVLKLTADAREVPFFRNSTFSGNIPH